MKIQIGKAQSQGARENQEDYFATLEFDKSMLCVLADGMGGHAGGEIASKTVVNAFLSCFEHLQDSVSPAENLSLSLTFAHNEMRQFIKAHRQLADMGTTIIASWFDKQGLIWLNVGDSPLYRYRDAKLTRLNADHSFAGETAQHLAAGEITADQAAATTKIYGHVLTSVVSFDDISLIEHQDDYYSVQDNDIYLLASDGIQTLSETMIASIISRNNEVKTIADSIINSIDTKKTPHQDNTSLIVVKIEQ